MHLPANFEIIPVTELNVGDTVRFHGARFQVHTAAMYKDHGPAEHGPVMTALATWIDGETMPGYFGPGKDWNFQGNQLHRVRRELPAPVGQHATIQSVYGTELHAAMTLPTPAERRAACDAAHARYEAACEEAGINLDD